MREWSENGLRSSDGQRRRKCRHMNNSPAQETLELKVTDFGPIGNATVDLRPLTVFVGPGNTGKSYLAMLIYALHRFYSEFGSSPAPILGGYRALRGLRTRKELPDETVEAIIGMVQMFLDARDLSEEPDILLPPSIRDSLPSEFEEDRFSLGREICYCFGVGDIRALIRKGRQRTARIRLRRRTSRKSARFVHRLAFSKQEITSKTVIPKKVRMQVDARYAAFARRTARTVGKRGRRTDDWRFEFSRLIEFMSACILPGLVEPLHRHVTYIPVGRAGVMRADDVAIDALLGRAWSARERARPPKAVFSGVFLDFLQRLAAVETDRFLRETQEGEGVGDIGSNIEEAILEGELRVGSPASIPRSDIFERRRFAFRPSGWKENLSLINVSSMVAALAPLVLCLRYVVRPGRVLVVEEPESHLHPAKQVELARQLAALVNAGVRVIVTTHSEWLLEELANIVQRAGVSEGNREKGEVALRQDQVGVWLFKPGESGGSTVTEATFDESGFYPSGFDEVAAGLHNDWAELSSRTQAEP